MKIKEELSRRKFIESSTLGALGTLGVAAIVTSCSNGTGRSGMLKLPEMLKYAPDGKPLKAGLIGCGGRGTGAALNFLDAGPNLQIVSLGDVFRDRIDSCREALKTGKNIEIAEEKCFTGFDSFEKVIDSGVDVVLLCTPPHFRPAHIEAAVNSGKHIFMEKPCAVDPFGARSVLISSKKAEQLGLCMVSGTIRRVQKDYMETYRRVANGEIGDIVSAHVIRNGGSLWRRERKPEWSDMEYMLRNWINFCWLSGDNLVEMFIHEIDVMNWFIGKIPVKAMGWGGRQRRISGDQYDFFSIEYLYDNGIRAHCVTRQINDCSNLKEEIITGTKGYANCNGTLYDHAGKETWKYPYPQEGDSDEKWKINDPYVQEHVNLVNAIRTGKPINDSEQLVNSTLITIMGRISAYTGKDVTWDEVLNSDLYLGPKTYVMGPVPGIPEKAPVIGTEEASI